MSTKEKIVEEVAIDELLGNQNVIVLFNDDVNTFDHVIDTLVVVCDHDPIQAEQCAFIIHYKGKCEIKSGPMKELIPMCTKLLDAGLSAEIH
ncbi:MAG TPA: ATP-dependent Clp protease adaptor ClpS [Flavobacterium sp.]|nr:ATP-dependent Clp protease adaptor ClpS [Flavobacterium sp.]